MELETDNQLPFLDVPVQRDGNRLNTSVYRKPTHKDQYLHFPQSPFPSQERDNFNPDQTSQEHLLHNRITRHRTINNTLNPDTKPPRQQAAPFTISLPFIGPTSHHIRRLLKQQATIDVIFQRGNTTQNLLQATGRPTPAKMPDPAGVDYQIDCDCGESYIDETSRAVTIRIKEHQATVRNKDSKSAITDHLKANPNHNISWNTTKVIEREPA
ncbi:uncharacterized protein LOC124269264 [Haliotis rubra]|uniref:uncharacterized protein LOC124269264 n=1 Tax=Haliotis rubra TaxID=36100 RepID=UPI001EE5D361|nr:uncharacterized protein LOC124269264 [Haliotis rubra]